MLALGAQDLFNVSAADLYVETVVGKPFLLFFLKAISLFHFSQMHRPLREIAESKRGSERREG